MEKAKEHEKMSEMLNQFKNKLITENCFHINYGAKRIVETPGVLKNNLNIEEVSISFLRDSTFEEEFFLVIEQKEFNQFGMKDKILIAIDDIDEIEHTEGLQFMVHYQAEPPRKSEYGGSQGQKKVKEAVGVAVAGLFAMINKNKKSNPDQPPSEDPLSKIEKSELFESKHVKTIIETFNNVLQIID